MSTELNKANLLSQVKECCLNVHDTSMKIFDQAESGRISLETAQNYLDLVDLVNDLQLALQAVALLQITR